MPVPFYTSIKYVQSGSKIEIGADQLYVDQEHMVLPTLAMFIKGSHTDEMRLDDSLDHIPNRI